MNLDFLMIIFNTMLQNSVLLSTTCMHVSYVTNFSEIIDMQLIIDNDNRNYNALERNSDVQFHAFP